MENSGKYLGKTGDRTFFEGVKKRLARGCETVKKWRREPVRNGRKWIPCANSFPQVLVENCTPTAFTFHISCRGTGNALLEMEALMIVNNHGQELLDKVFWPDFSRRALFSKKPRTPFP